MKKTKQGHTHIFETLHSRELIGWKAFKIKFGKNKAIYDIINKRGHLVGRLSLDGFLTLYNLGYTEKGNKQYFGDNYINAMRYVFLKHQQPVK